jgi:hypothetical protein
MQVSGFRRYLTRNRATCQVPSIFDASITGKLAHDKFFYSIFLSY